MAQFDGIRRALRVHFGARSVQRAIDEEIAFHLEARAGELRRRGLSEDEARETAVREFGDVSAARHELASIDRRTANRQAWLAGWFDLWRDVAIALRSMRRHAMLTAAILSTLALGIGANGAIFTVMRAALLAPLPYERPDRLVHLWQVRASDNARTKSSYPDFVDLRTGARSLSRIEGYDPTNVTVGGDIPTMTRGGRVTAGFFAMLGVRPALGRTFVDGEDQPGAPHIVLLSDGLWRRRFGADLNIVGRPLAIDGAAYVIIGVLPPGFHFAPIGAAELWLPLDQSLATRAARSDRWLNLIARLRNGATVDGASREVAGIARRLADASPQTNAGLGAIAIPLRDQIVGDVRPLLLVLTGAVTLVLLVACANVAGLLLARSLSRTREFAVRTALGASRGRLVRQVITESTLVAVIGGGLAALVAGLGSRVLVAAIPEGVRSGMPYWTDVSASTRTLLYTMTVALAAGVALGLVPALTATRASLDEVLRRGGRGVAGGRTRVRDVLIAGEIAVTIVLLVGTGLLVRSLGALSRVDPGFNAEQVVTARIALAGPRYATDDARRRFFDEVLGRVRVIPGVAAAGAVSNLPLSGSGTTAFRVSGSPERSPSERAEAVMRAVAADYFEAMRIRLIEGRRFTPRDDAAAGRVILINASLARQLFPTGHALGSRFRFAAFPDRDGEVIGVVADVKTGRLDADAPPTIYYSQLQAPENRLSLAIRVACPTASITGPGNAASCVPNAVIGAIRRAVATSDPSVSVYAVGTMEQQVTDSPAVFARRYPLLLIGLFAATALVLSVVGLYGVISYAVAQRTREFGIRLALGSSDGGIRGLVLQRGAVVASTGVAIGVPVAFGAARLMRGMLYGVDASDPLTYVVACVVLAAVALLASWVPARRATRIQPTVALRSDE